MPDVDIPREAVAEYQAQVNAQGESQALAERVPYEGEEPQTEPQQRAPDTGASDEAQFEIETTEGVQKVTLKELRDGYLRRADYTRKSQELSRQRDAFEQQRAAQAADRPLGLDGVPGAYDPWGAFSAAGQPGVQRAVAPVEQPVMGRTAGGYAAPASAQEVDDNIVTAQDVRQIIAAERAAMQMENQRILAGIQRHQAEAAAMADLQSRYEDFSEQACMEQFYRLPTYEQQRMKLMSKAAAMEILHLRTRNARPAQQSRSKPEEPPKVPYTEPPRNSDVAVPQNSAAKPPDNLRDRAGLTRWYMDNVIQPGQSRRP